MLVVPRVSVCDCVVNPFEVVFGVDDSLSGMSDISFEAWDVCESSLLLVAARTLRGSPANCGTRVAGIPGWMDGA